MGIKKYDVIKLKESDGALKERGVNSGCEGIVVEKEKGVLRILLLSPYNHGDYIFATVEERSVDFIGELPPSLIEELKSSFNQKAIYDDGKKFKANDVKEYDIIEMLVDKPEYNENGVYKGMRGVVMSSHAVKDGWYVIFSEDNTGKDIADICVKRKDFTVIK